MEVAIAQVTVAEESGSIRRQNWYFVGKDKVKQQ
jgi:hypothetical protein